MCQDDNPDKMAKDYIKFLESQPKGFIYNDTSKSAVTGTNKQQSVKNNQSMLDDIKQKCTNCAKCNLAIQGRQQVVFGVGNPNAELMFIGEGPGRDEDKQGKPFVGRAGQLLTKIIEAMKLTRDDVYISNVVKCRPPENRAPLPVESETCKNLILFKEIEIIKPKIICALGATALQGLMGDGFSISKVRGQFLQFKDILVMPTYHPAYLLRNPDAKRFVWEDMKTILYKLTQSCDLI
ncbi:MAG: Uracil-DNA glycosylase [candidate division TM6 bacterium GW2011_GWF2_37_49]|nr:MAG: Uracil-DNA glycosylase [candidate division TM6 bacterium GW2011_GWF2_37_49]